jgi:hypothetical protein
LNLYFSPRNVPRLQSRTMAEIIQCPSCREKVQVPESFAGRHVQCPVCSATFMAPAANAPPPVQRPADAYIEEPARRHERQRDRYDDDYDDYDEPERFRRGGYAPNRAAAVLTLGILSLVILACAPVLGPMAWIMGNNDLREMRAGRMDPSGEGATTAGRICGIIGTCLSATVICLYAFMLAALAGRGGGF